MSEEAEVEDLIETSWNVKEVMLVVNPVDYIKI